MAGKRRWVVRGDTYRIRQILREQGFRPRRIGETWLWEKTGYGDDAGAAWAARLSGVAVTSTAVEDE